ncbi:MAG: tyrosine-protein phosphatase [Nocardioidaceae bacterium]|nr:tyrosine-protein phosphatase [Nocardioidaceae bacterium]
MGASGGTTDAIDHSARWLRLEGAVNARDLGGLPLRDGGATATHRLLRSDNLQGLSPYDVRLLGGEMGLSDVVDLRTDTERKLEGPAPLDDEHGVTVHHLSLLPGDGDEVREREGDFLLPWQQAPDEVPAGQEEASTIYVSYLEDRPDSVVSALRVVARATGATVVHCAAGKDRTGVVVALALDLVGVHRGPIVEDYLLTGERIDAILARLSASPTYASNLRGRGRDSHLPRTRAITDVFDLVDTHQGTAGWLAGHGWTDADTRALQRRLTG